MAALGAGLASALGAAANTILGGQNSQSTTTQYGYNGGGSSNQAWQKVYGSYASAQDILRASEANMQGQSFLQQQQAFNADQARLQREWEEYMSNTSYQRAVKDLISAGLNPILAVSGMSGASTPGGAVATSGLQSAAKANTYADQESHSSGESHFFGENWLDSMSTTLTQFASMVEGVADMANSGVDVANNIVSTMNNAIDKVNSKGVDKLTGNRKNDPKNDGGWQGRVARQKQQSYKTSLKGMTDVARSIHQ